MIMQLAHSGEGIDNKKVYVRVAEILSIRRARIDNQSELFVHLLSNLLKSFGLQFLQGFKVLFQSQDIIIIKKKRIAK